MPFATTTTNGLGEGGTFTCNTAQRTAITNAFSFMGRRLTSCVTPLAGEMTELVACLLSQRNFSNVVIDCPSAGGNCSSNVFGWTTLGSNVLRMCPSGLPPRATAAEANVTLFHELIHTCGGLEIDAWACENHCYRGLGTINPVGMVSTFLSETTALGGGLRAGRFVVWDPSTGQVRVKVETGGDWISSPTIGRGTALNVVARFYRSP
jgi:hypothetical protein